MTSNFRGQVKVSDIQEEFDALVSKVNNLIDMYNAAIEAGDISLENGNPSLSPMGYTLSVGGLKSILAAYNGRIIGSKVIKVGDGYVVTPGIAITTSGAIELKSGYVNGVVNSYVNYNISTNRWSFSNTKGTYSIKINPYRKSLMLNTSTTPLVDTTTKYYVKSNAGSQYGLNQTVNTATKDLFMTHWLNYHGGNIKFNNVNIAKWFNIDNNVKSAWHPCIPFYIPQGVSNPWSNDGADPKQYIFGVIKK